MALEYPSFTTLIAVGHIQEYRTAPTPQLTTMTLVLSDATTLTILQSDAMV